MKPKIAICGTPLFVTKFFEHIIKQNKYEIAFCLTKRGSAVEEWCFQQNILCLEIDSPQLMIKLQEIECILVFAYGKIIPHNLLILTHWLNVHPSALPLFRGPAPVEYAILSGANESAITLMQMNEKMDQGDILAQLPFKINVHHNKKAIFFELTCFGPTFVYDNMDKFLQGKITSRKQSNQATYSKIIKKSMNVIGENSSVQEIILQIRSLGFVYLNIGEIKVQCYLARAVTQDSLINVNGLEPIFVKAPGKKILHIKAFLNGLRNQAIIVDK